MKANSMI